MLGPNQLNPTKPNGCHIEVTQPCFDYKFKQAGAEAEVSTPLSLEI